MLLQEFEAVEGVQFDATALSAAVKIVEQAAGLQEAEVDNANYAVMPSPPSPPPSPPPPPPLSPQPTVPPPWTPPPAPSSPNATNTTTSVNASDGSLAAGAEASPGRRLASADGRHVAESHTTIVPAARSRMALRRRLSDHQLAVGGCHAAGLFNSSVRTTYIQVTTAITTSDQAKLDAVVALANAAIANTSQITNARGEPLSKCTLPWVEGTGRVVIPAPSPPPAAPLIVAGGLAIADYVNGAACMQRVHVADLRTFAYRRE